MVNIYNSSVVFGRGLDEIPSLFCKSHLHQHEEFVLDKLHVRSHRGGGVDEKVDPIFYHGAEHLSAALL